MNIFYNCFSCLARHVLAYFFCWATHFFLMQGTFLFGWIYLQILFQMAHKPLLPLSPGGIFSQCVFLGLSEGLVF